MRYLITHSLLSSWNYLHTCREECQESAYAEFIDTLNRVPKETTPEMQNGIDFENLCYEIAKKSFVPEIATDGAVNKFSGEIMGYDKYPKFYNGACKVATVIKSAPTQVKASRELTVGSIDLIVYGILDVLKAGTIYDVKFSNKGFGSAELAGKYLDSTQHPTYFYLVPEAHAFQYLVSDGEDLYTETYTRENTRPFEEIAREFLSSLEAMHLLDVYKSCWQAK